MSTANIHTGNIRQGKFLETGNLCENFLPPNLIVPLSSKQPFKKLLRGVSAFSKQRGLYKCRDDIRVGEQFKGEALLTPMPELFEEPHQSISLKLPNREYGNDKLFLVSDLDWSSL